MIICKTVCAFCYYGVVLMTTELFESAVSSCTRNQSMGLKPLESCTAECKTLTTQDYIDLLWTTLAEFPGYRPWTHVGVKDVHKVYPTQLRSVGVGTCSAMARLGAMVTPYVAQNEVYSQLCDGEIEGRILVR
uniref:Uncharacterized protein n=1 Tax=Timema poppense TaxID=170557 RepID=A0A7R9DE19_TIMPO|nr:unnamed protein product [Timema poppensis]